MTKTVGDVLQNKESQEVVAIPASATVSEAVAVMSRQHVGAIVIRNQDGPIDGIFTERDLLSRVVDEGRDPKTTLVSVVMSHDIRHVAPSTTVEEALRLMVVHRHRHLLVMEDSRVHGLISIRDLMYRMIDPLEPIAHEGRVGILRARAEDAIRAVQGINTGDAPSL